MPLMQVVWNRQQLAIPYNVAQYYYETTMFLLCVGVARGPWGI